MVALWSRLPMLLIVLFNLALSLPLVVASATCSNHELNHGTRQLWVPGCKGSGCGANGIDNDCAWCVFNLTKCMSDHASATTSFCQDVVESRQNAGIMGCCDTERLVESQGPLTTVALRDQDLCWHATQHAACVNDHLVAFKASAAFIGAHGQTLSNETLQDMFAAMYTASPENGSALDWDLDERAKSESIADEQESDPVAQHGDPWLTAMMTKGLTYNVTTPHNRSDSFAPGCPSGKRLVDAWTRHLFFRRYLPQLNESFPPQVKVNTTAKFISTVESVLQDGGGEFHLMNVTQLEDIRSVIKGVNWSNMIIHVYAAFPDVFGQVYSPAYNALFLVWDKTTHALSHYVIIAANGGGDAETKYIGVEFQEEYQSIAGYLYTPLTGSTQNPLNYRMEPFDPTNNTDVFAFHIRLWYVKHPYPSGTYIDVSTLIRGSPVKKITTPAVVSMTAKNYYMLATSMAYYAGSGLPARIRSGLQAINRTLVPHEFIPTCSQDAQIKAYFGTLPLFMRLHAALFKNSSLPWVVEPVCQTDSAALSEHEIIF